MTFVALGHLSLAVLASMDRLAITVPAESRLLLQMADNGAWLVIHLVCSLFIWISLWYNKFEIQAMSMSCGFIGVWGFINLLWGLNTPRPVSLAGPILGMTLAGVSWSVAMSWAQGGTHDKGR